MPNVKFKGPWTKSTTGAVNAPLFRRSLTAIVLAVAANTSAADDAWSPIPAKPAALPEAMLLPMTVEGRTIGGGGWILTYRNDLRGSEIPDREVESRTVTFHSQTGKQVSATVSWEITRTQNNQCADRRKAMCPDILRVLIVPDGFIAVPQSVVANEQTSVRVLIVPAGIG